MKKSFTVHDLPPAERPRERLLKHGIEALSVQELLALILGRGIKDESVILTAQKIVSHFGDLRNLAKASIEELTTIKGIGPAKAAQIKAAFEMSKRLDNYPDEVKKVTVKSPEDAIKAIRNQLKGKKKEHFMVLSLDTRNHVTNTHQTSIGSLDSSMAHPREVFRDAIADSASSVIFIHNHPSGDPTPSEDDIKLTKRLTEVGDIVGIEVMDHIIVCDRDHLSMKAKGLF